VQLQINQCACHNVLIFWTVEDKKKALDAVVLLEEKRNGDTKVRSCANCSKQRMYLKEYESVASPTVSLEGLLLHLVIGACPSWYTTFRVEFESACTRF